jgi:hypothetical protein
MLNFMARGDEVVRRLISVDELGCERGKQSNQLDMLGRSVRDWKWLSNLLKSSQWVLDERPSFRIEGDM